MLTDYTPPCVTPNTIEQAMQRAELMRASWTGDTVLTPRGAAVAALHRLTRSLAQLDAADLEEVGPLLASILVETARRRCAAVTPTTA